MNVRLSFLVATPNPLHYHSGVRHRGKRGPVQRTRFFGIQRIGFSEADPVSRDGERPNDSGTGWESRQGEANVHPRLQTSTPAYNYLGASVRTLTLIS